MFSNFNVESRMNCENLCDKAYVYVILIILLVVESKFGDSLKILRNISSSFVIYRYNF